MNQNNKKTQKQNKTKNLIDTSSQPNQIKKQTVN